MVCKAKEVLWYVKGKDPWQRNVVIMKFFNEFFNGEDKTKTREDNRTVILDLFPPKKMTLLGIYTLKKKINTFIFWCVVIPLGPHSVYTK